MSAIAEATDRSQGTLVDLDLPDRAVREAAPSADAVRVRCTHVDARADALVLELMVTLPARTKTAPHHIPGFHADVTGV